MLCTVLYCTVLSCAVLCYSPLRSGLGRSKPTVGQLTTEFRFLRVRLLALRSCLVLSCMVLYLLYCTYPPPTARGNLVIHTAEAPILSHRAGRKALFFKAHSHHQSQASKWKTASTFQGPREPVDTQKATASSLHRLPRVVEMVR